MDGYQVARRLRREAGLETAQMVAMTGRPEEATRNPEDTGVERLLLKPVGAEALREVIEGA
jgi:CheY-like chemotaxis protein